jgi:hypothetical protein
MALALSGYATDNSTENGHQMSSIVPVSCPLLAHYQTSPRLLKRALNALPGSRHFYSSAPGSFLLE